MTPRKYDIQPLETSRKYDVQPLGPKSDLPATSSGRAPQELTGNAPDADSLDFMKPESAVGATMQGAIQGGSLGFGDELMGAADTALDAQRRLRETVGISKPKMLDGVPAVNPNGPTISKSWDPSAKPAPQKPVIPEQPPIEAPETSLANAYRAARDSYRGDAKKAQEAHPALYGGAELVGGLSVPLPGGALAKGASLAKKVAQGAKTAGVVGATIGAGKSEAEDIGGVAADAALSGVVAAPLGALGGLAGHAADKFGARFGAKAAAARAARDEAIAKAVKEEERTLLGKARQKTQEASRDIEVLARPNDPRGIPTQAKVNQFLDSPEARELANKVSESKLASAPERLQEMATKQAEYETFKAAAPGEVARRIAEQEKKGIASEATPRLKTFLTRVLPPVIGSGVGSMVSDDPIVGGTVGAAAGGVLAATMGAPGTAFANMMKSPAFQIGMAELKQGVSNKFSDVLGKFAPIVAAQTSEAGIEAALKKAAAADPSIPAKLKQATEASQSKPRNLKDRFGGR